MAVDSLPARHLYGCPVDKRSLPAFGHRIDVIMDGVQYGVDFETPDRDASGSEIDAQKSRILDYIENETGKRPSLDLKSFDMNDEKAWSFFTQKIGEVRG